ncbi:MAG: VWA domain-containing protein, partial [Gammaproteobacteria bacterium]|nr:VWA domain-containing protein [Gammaproteobacteria bacterium]
RIQRLPMPSSLPDARKGQAPLAGQAYLTSGDADLATPAPRLDQREEYAKYQANPIRLVADEPVSTFSIDVDTASYSLVRNQLNSGYLPKPQAVRAEELINYFDYDYPVASSRNQPFKPSLSVFDSPWNEGKKLVHIGIKGYDIPANQIPDSNLVFLLDVSGSMNAANKLPLVKQSLGLLLETLKPTDTVSIVVYAGAAGVVLEPTQVKEKSKILSALGRLNAGGSTAGGAGIRLAYQLAEQGFAENSVNRIILATDGDFNVGQKSNEDLQTLVERKRDSGVFLSVLGFGRNNYQDDMMQTLAQNGNGVAAYIDTLSEAKKVLVDEATSTLFPIAKDVKIQVEFNPSTVSEYRLIGYETRHLNREDFNNDKVDAGEIGAGHSVTAIYEITPADSQQQSIDKPRYLENQANIRTSSQSNEYGFLKIRYKLPGQTKSRLIETAIPSESGKLGSDVQFSTAVAGFAQLLAGSKYTGTFSYDDVISLAGKHKGDDSFGYRAEFIQLVRMAKIAQP